MNFRFVVLESPYDNWSNPQVGPAFVKMVELKLKGFSAQYPEGVLPVGDSDFIGIHQIVCEEKGGDLIPVIGNYTVTTEAAAKHNLTFPALSLAQSVASEPHIRAVENIVSSCAASGRRLAYDGGWTVAPEYKKSREIILKLHQTFLGMKVHFIRHYKIDEMITAGAVRFRVKRTGEFLGYKPMELDGNLLPDVSLRRFCNEKVLLLHMPTLKESAIDFAERFQFMWNSRITIGVAREAVVAETLGEIKKTA